MKKGFTLIEVMSTLIILSVITLITVPIVSNMLEESRVKARMESVRAYASSVKIAFTENKFDDTLDSKELGEKLRPLADTKMSGDEVSCDIVQYNKDSFETLLHGCNVKGVGNFCFLNGNVYEGSTAECSNVGLIAENGGITYLQPLISSMNKTPNNYTHYQSNEININYQSLKVVNEYYYIKSNKRLDVTVLESCGSDRLPSDCTKASSFYEDTWYRIDPRDNNLKILLKENQTVEAITGENKEFGPKLIYNETNIDAKAPITKIKNVTSTTSKVFLYASCSAASGINKYEYSFDGGKTYLVGNSDAYAYSALKDTEYEVSVRCTSNSGLVSTSNVEKIKTKNILKPIITQASQTPINSEWANKRVINIEYLKDEIGDYSFYFKTTTDIDVLSDMIVERCDDNLVCTSINTTKALKNVWYRVSSSNINLNLLSNATIYATTKESTNTISSTYEVVNVDSIAPTISIEVANKSTNSVTLKATCNDTLTHITKYEFSKDGVNYIDNGLNNTYTFDNLSQDTNTNYYARCTDLVDNKNVDSIESKTLKITNPKIEGLTKDSNWVTERDVKITYINTGILVPSYYFKSTVDAKSSIDASSCTDALECSGSTKDIKANTWYKVDALDVILKYKANGEVYAKTLDGVNTSGTSYYNISKVDSGPTLSSISSLSSKTDRIVVVASCSALSGIKTYEYSLNGGAYVTGTSNHTFSNLNQNTNYKVKVRCTSNSNVSSESETNSIKTKEIVNPKIKQIEAQINSGYTYAINRKVQITYDGTNINNPKYYFYSTAAATSSVSVQECDSSLNCSGSTTNIKANTWYKVSSNVNLLYFETATLRAITKDEYNNYKGSTDYSIADIDNQAPGVPNITSNVNLNGTFYTDIRITATASDNIGIHHIEMDINGDGVPDTSGSWIPTISNGGTWTVGDGWAANARFRAVDNAGNVSNWTGTYQIRNGYAPTLDFYDTDYTYGDDEPLPFGYNCDAQGCAAVSCKNNSTGDTVNNINQLPIGKNSVTCSVNGNNGLTTNKTQTIEISGAWSGSSPALALNSPGYKSGNSIYLPLGYSSMYGPYASIIPGNYTVHIYGSGLTSLNIIRVYYNYGQTDLAVSCAGNDTHRYCNFSVPHYIVGELEVCLANHNPSNYTSQYGTTARVNNISIDLR